MSEARTPTRSRLRLVLWITSPLAVLGAMFFASWQNRRIDLHRLSMSDLVLTYVNAEAAHDGETLAAAMTELTVRDQVSRWQQMVSLTASADLPVRVAAIKVLADDLAFRGDPQAITAEFAATCESALHELLDDVDENVRCNALRALVAVQVAAPWTEIPADVMTAMRLQMQSRSELCRVYAIDNLMRLGRTAQSLATEVLAMDVRGRDSSLAFFVATTLGRMQLREPRAVARLLELLDHESPEVRLAAASSLGELGEVAAPATPRLLAMSADALEREDVRRRVVQALVELARRPADVDQALRRLLGLRTVYEQAYALGEWGLAAGKLASRTTDTELAGNTLALLDDAQLTGSPDSLLHACSIARIANVRHDETRLSEALLVLQRALDEARELECYDWNTLQPVCEVLLDLHLAQPPVTVGLEALRHTLEVFRRDEQRWVREWAQDLSQRLPQ